MKLESLVRSFRRFSASLQHDSPTAARIFIRAADLLETEGVDELTEARQDLQAEHAGRIAAYDEVSRLGSLLDDARAGRGVTRQLLATAVEERNEARDDVAFLRLFLKRA